jgi:hypothetical protein
MFREFLLLVVEIGRELYPREKQIQERVFLMLSNYFSLQVKSPPQIKSFSRLRQKERFFAKLQATQELGKEEESSITMNQLVSQYDLPFDLSADLEIWVYETAISVDSSRKFMKKTYPLYLNSIATTRNAHRGRYVFKMWYSEFKIFFEF